MSLYHSTLNLPRTAVCHDCGGWTGIDHDCN
jgi:hypothetical protein